jgi:hypothetical protein
MARCNTDVGAKTAAMQVVYVASGEAGRSGRRTIAGLMLSAVSLRRFHPAAKIICICDIAMGNAVSGAGSPLRRLVDDVLVVPDLAGGPVCRSRHLKTTLRERLEGSFLYLDTDTVVTGSLEELFSAGGDIAMALDVFFRETPGMFPRWLAEHYARLGWLPTKRYFTSGVMRVADSPAARALFAAWHDLWIEGLREGLAVDQPALNRAIEVVGADVVCLPECDNWLVVDPSRAIPTDARIVHFCRTHGPIAVEYEAFLDRATDGNAIDADALAAAFQPGSSLAWRAPQPWSEMMRRVREWLQRGAARQGWLDIRRR